MKKIVSIVCVLVLCFSCLCFPYATENTALVYGHKSAEKLTKLGVLTGFSVDSDSLSESVSRGEMCKVLVELTKSNIISKDGGAVFYDVEKENENYDYIMTAFALGYVSGRADGTFAPSENVTAKDGIKMLLSALGYDDYAKNKGGYPFGYLETANEVGLMKKVKGLKAEDFLTKGALAELCSVALEDVALMKPYLYGDKTFMEGEKGTSLLIEKHGILKGRNTVSANDVTSIYSSGGKTKKGYIKIGERVFSYNGSDSDYLLGLECDYYYKDKAETVLYISPIAQNDITEVSADLITKAEDGVITYEVGSSYERIYTDLSTTVILNGVFTASYDDIVLNPDVGAVTAIDRDRDGVADILKIYSFDTYVVDKVDINSGTIYDKFGKAPIKISGDNKEYMIKFGSQNVLIDALEEWDVLEIGANKVVMTDDGIRADAKNADYFYIIALNDRVIGSLTEISKEKCKIEGVEFKVDSYFMLKEKADEFRPGRAGNFLLGYGDRIVAARYDDTTDVMYGFLFGVYLHDDLSENLELEIIDESGKTETFTSASKMRLNNEYKLTPATVFEKLDTPNENGFKSYDNIIKFRLNSKKEITELYTFTDKTQIKDYKGYSEEEFTKDFVVNNLVYRAGNQRLFAGKYQINNDLKVFYIPQENKKAQKEYAQVKGSGYFEGNLYYSDVEFFDVTKERSVTVALVKPTVESFLGNESPVIVVDELLKASLPDGSVGTEIKGYSSGKEASVFAYDSSLEEQTDWNKEKKTIAELKKGDIIQYATNSEGLIIGFRVLFSKTDKSAYFEKAAGGTVEKDNYYAVLYTGFGKIREVNETNIIFNGNTDNQDLVCSDPAWDRTIPYAGCGIYKYDAKTNRLKVVDKAELFEGYDAFVYTHLTNTKEIIMFAD